MPKLRANRRCTRQLMVVELDGVLGCILILAPLFLIEQRIDPLTGDTGPPVVAKTSTISLMEAARGWTLDRPVRLMTAPANPAGEEG